MFLDSKHGDYNVNTQEAEAEELQIQRQSEQLYKVLSQKTTKRGNCHEWMGANTVCF